ncbi:MAG TPA: glycosyltransferase [Spirochaetota bacterium]|nr:glycosyltransferase [Spirochaetota bacterium]
MKENVLIAGVDYAMPKLFYFKEFWREKGYGYVFYGNDRMKVMKKFPDVPFYSSHINKNSDLLFVLQEILLLKKIARKENIRYCEYYYTAPFLQMLVVLAVMKLCRITVISIYRGGEIYYWRRHSFFKKYFLKTANRLSHKIAYKEMYMPEILKNNGMFHQGRMYHWANSIEYAELPSDYISRKENVLLFHNSFKEWRHPDFLIDVINRLKEKTVNFKLILAGYREDADNAILKIINEKINNYGLSKFVEIYDFAANEPEFYYKKSKIFLLPSDLVYCNYSLLEAMNYGVVPLVSELDNDSHLIIDHESDGYIVPNDEDRWSSLIYELLTDENKFERMSKLANLKIYNDYNSQKRFEKYYDFIKVTEF